MDTNGHIMTKMDRNIHEKYTEKQKKTNLL